MMTGNRARRAALLFGAALACGAANAQAAGTLTVAMTAGDLPATTGNPDQGFEGYRFVGYNLYDSLVLWDLSGKNADKAADIKPGLATEWQVDEANPKRWIFKLRKGVKLHDGCDFTADDVVWNMAYSTDEKAPQFNPAQFAQARAYLGTYASVEKIDDYTVAFTTKVPDSLFPYMISYVLMVSPCRAKEVKYDWKIYAEKPSGTGPYKFDKAVPHQRMELLPNKEYWDKDRVPKQDRLVLIPMPEASTRTAALLSGQVNWVEAPSPDAIDRLKSSGMQIVTKVYPHNWSYQLNFAQGPVRRQAGAAGRQLRAQSRGHEGPAQRADARRIRDRAAVHDVLRQAGPVQIRSGQGQGAAEGSRLHAVQGDVRDLDLRLRADAAAADERTGQIPARRRRFRRDAAVDGLERAAAGRPRRRRREPRHPRDQYQPRRRRTRSTR